MLNIGTKVKLVNASGHGTIVSEPFLIKDEEMYAVELSEGFYNPDKTCFVRILIVHPDNMELYEDE